MPQLTIDGDFSRYHCTQRDSLIQDCLAAIPKTETELPICTNKPLNDPNIFELFADGDTDGISLLEPSIVRRHLQMLKTDGMDDVLACLALHLISDIGYDEIEDIVLRKCPPFSGLHQLESTLAPTCGVILFDDQFIGVLLDTTNYSLDESVEIHRRMKNPKPEETAELRIDFLERALALNIQAATAHHIFDELEQAAPRTIRRSYLQPIVERAVMITYLKKYYPQEFAISLSRSSKCFAEKVLKRTKAFEAITHYKKELDRLNITPLRECRAMQPDTYVNIAAMLFSSRKELGWEIDTEIAEITDQTASGEAILRVSCRHVNFPDISTNDFMAAGRPVFIKGRINHTSRTCLEEMSPVPRISIWEMYFLADAIQISGQRALFWK